MKEDFLHYLWRFQKLGRPTLKTVSLDPVTVVHPGLRCSVGFYLFDF